MANTTEELFLKPGGAASSGHPGGPVLPGHQHVLADIIDVSSNAELVAFTQGIRPGLFDELDEPPVGAIIESATDGHLYWIHRDGQVHLLCDSGGYGGAAVWGSITGTLADQTDLVAALNARQLANPNLTAFAAITGAAGQVPKFTGAGTLGTFTISTAGESLVGSATVADMVDTLGGAASSGTGGLVRQTSPGLLGNPTAPTQTAGNSSTRIATTAFVQGELGTATGTGGVVRQSSPTLTGTPLAPTAAGGTNTTQIATTAFVQSELAAAVTGLLELKGSTDCSANPNYPAGLVGDVYYVTVAGRIGGASGKVVDVGDAYVCRTNNAGGTEASVGTSWFVLEKNLAGALLAANNLSDVADPNTARANLGLTIGTHVQAQNANLQALAALVGVADRLAYFTGSGAMALATFTAAARTLLDDATVADMVNTLGGATSTGTGGLVRAASPTFTGAPLAPTATTGTNTTQVATTGFVQQELGTTTGTGGVVRATSPTLAGTPLAPTATTGTNTTQIATTAFVQGELGTTTGTGGVVRATSPTLAGTPLAPTAAGGTNTTQIATTAFVQSAVSAAVSGLLDLKGDLACAANPNYPAGSVGDLYYVSSPGRVGGASGKIVDIGDAIVCKTTNGGGTEASVGTSWFVLEKNLDGALLAINNLSDISNQTAAQGNLGLLLGVDVQAQNANLQALAGLSGVADRLAYFTGSGAMALATITAAARTLLDDTTVAAMVNTLGGVASTGSDGLVRYTSPALLGTPTAPTAALGTDTNQIANTSFVRNEIEATVIDVVPSPGQAPSRYWLPYHSMTVTTTTLVAGELRYLPFQVVGVGYIMTKIGVNVTTAHASSIRLGIYNGGTGGAIGTPNGAPLLDAGTVSAATAGIKEITISQALDPGWYWLAILAEGTPTITADDLTGAVIVGGLGTLAANGGPVTEMKTTGVAWAALPSTGSLTRLSTGVVPRVFLRRGV